MFVVRDEDGSESMPRRVAPTHVDCLRIRSPTLSLHCPIAASARVGRSVGQGGTERNGTGWDGVGLVCVN